MNGPVEVDWDAGLSSRTQWCKGRRLVSSLIGFCFFVSVFTCAHGATIYVDVGNVSGTENGIAWGTAYTSIQTAIGTAGSGDEIWVAQGTYLEALTLVSEVGVYGGFDKAESVLADRDWEANETIVDAIGLMTSVATMSITTSAALDGFTLTGGDAVSGGGIFIEDADATNEVANCVIKNNDASGAGGGVFVSDCSVEVRRCRVYGNASQFGGGVAVFGSASTLIESCVIAGNYSSSWGGGIILSSSKATIVGCTISGNVSESDGGGGITFLSSNFFPELINCVVSGNEGSFGSNIYTNLGNFIEVSNCTIADGEGGEAGIYFPNSEGGIFTNCLIAGHGIAMRVPTSATFFSLDNCLFFGNGADLVEAGGFERTGAAAINTGFFPGAIGSVGGNVDGDPKFVGGLGGDWTGSAVYHGASNTTTFTDGAGGYALNELKGELINPNTAQSFQALVLSNTATSIVVAGDLTGIVTVGNESYAMVDYRLTWNSNAIDLGIATSAPTDDFDGNSRPFGSDHDIGAFEFNGYIWVDFGWPGTQRGTTIEPFSGFVLALGAVPSDGRILVNGDSSTTSSAWTGQISTKMTIDSYDGTVRIGQ